MACPSGTALSSPTRDGQPQPAADAQPGVALARLVVFGIETASAPVAVRRAAQAAWVYHWSGILSVSA